MPSSEKSSLLQNQFVGRTGQTALAGLLLGPQGSLGEVAVGKPEDMAADKNVPGLALLIWKSKSPC